MANGWIKSASAGHAMFENVGVDLSEYQGQTVTVSFAVTPGADDRALNFLTMFVGTREKESLTTDDFMKARKDIG